MCPYCYSDQPNNCAKCTYQPHEPIYQAADGTFYQAESPSQVVAELAKALNIKFEGKKYDR